jgi:hypothetical protein
VVVEVQTPTELSDRERALIMELAKLQQAKSREEVFKEKKPGAQGF